ncbi:MAG: hypothetical protein BGO11_15105 [Solirubrobacterales bacterium 70-9]|nr:MAG: hypothetical protein BGO11_15105 [Solirubrobacterales bacterium 70-9]
MLGTPSGEAAGQGLTVTLGGAGALSGAAASAYGKDFLRGIKLAMRHISEAGGPSFNFQPRDNGGGDTSKTPGYMREFGAEHTPVLLTSFAANSQSENPFYEQFEILALDGGASAAAALASVPWYYVMTTVTGLQTPGVIEYIKSETPEVKRVTSFLQDTDAKTIEGYRKFITGAVEEGGLESAGEVLFSDYTQTDFSAQISELRSQNPQAILVTMFGAQVGTFVKQFAASGIEADIYGYDWVPDTSTAAGSAATSFNFTGVYFDPERKESAWEKYYVEQYEEEFGTYPTTYSTIYYENTFHVWQLVMQIIKAGADPTEPGEHWVKAVEEHPEFWAVRGGKGSNLGSVKMDLKTQAFEHQENVLATGTVLPKLPEVRATFDIDGSNFQKV